jgi:hypothetical protein
MEFKEKTVDSLGPAVGSKPVINFRFVADNFSFVPGLRIRIWMGGSALFELLDSYLLVSIALQFTLYEKALWLFFKVIISLKKLFVPGKMKIR